MKDLSKLNKGSIDPTASTKHLSPSKVRPKSCLPKPNEFNYETSRTVVIKPLSMYEDTKIGNILLRKGSTIWIKMVEAEEDYVIAYHISFHDFNKFITGENFSNKRTTLNANYFLANVSLEKIEKELSNFGSEDNFIYKVIITPKKMFKFDLNNEDWLAIEFQEKWREKQVGYENELDKYLEEQNINNINEVDCIELIGLDYTWFKDTKEYVVLNNNIIRILNKKKYNEAEEDYEFTDTILPDDEDKKIEEWMKLNSITIESFRKQIQRKYNIVVGNENHPRQEYKDLDLNAYVNTIFIINSFEGVVTLRNIITGYQLENYIEGIPYTEDGQIDKQNDEYDELWNPVREFFEETCRYLRKNIEIVTQNGYENWDIVEGFNQFEDYEWQLVVYEKEN
jgi:hypothetical protein